MLWSIADIAFQKLSSLKATARWALPAFLSFASLIAPTVAPAQNDNVLQKPLANPREADQVVLIPWAVGNKSNIINLRQPRGFTSIWTGMFQAMLGPGYGDQTLRDRKSAMDFTFSALLPDMQPWTKETLPDFKKPGGGAVVEGLVTSVVFATKAPTPDASLRVLLDGARKSLLGIAQERPPGVVIGPKPPRFGLNRIGPVNLPQNRSPYYRPNDIYFEGDSPENSPFFIECHAEELPTKEDDPHSKLVAQCIHYISSEELWAVVRLSYRREYLKDWRDINLKVKKLLTSFMP